MSRIAKRLKNMYERFLKLSPEKQAEFLKSFEQVKQLATSSEVLELFNELEEIFKAGVKQ